MKVLSTAILSLVFLGTLQGAEVPPVEIRAGETTAWTGERVRLYVELRANGSFSGSSSFDLPGIPGTLLVRAGNPVVSSKEIEGESWFVQTHEFALFSQKTGAVEIPPFTVRFGHREGFTGPVSEKTVETEALSIEIRRPPGSESIPFLVTTETMEVSETWEPVPEAAKVGDVFRRTIVQRANGLTGMALLPAPTTAPDGVRVYEPQVETSDNTERGAFRGERRETITYLLQQAGEITLPELTYTWWNPKSETLQSKVLPGVTVPVEAVAADIPAGEASAKRFWPFSPAGAVLVALLIWQRQRIAGLGRRIHRALDPPERAAARKLCRACRKNDPVAAQGAWNRWLAIVGRDFRPGEGLHAAVLEMQKVLFATGSSESWEGKKLLGAFREQRCILLAGRKDPPGSELPPLNRPEAYSTGEY